MNLKEIKSKLKDRFEEAPEQFILAGVIAITMLGKAADSFASAESKRAYAKAINRKNRRR